MFWLNDSLKKQMLWINKTEMTWKRLLEHAIIADVKLALEFIRIRQLNCKSKINLILLK